MYRAIADYRDFIIFALRNERTASFAGTVLGSLWSYIFPIIQVIIYYFLVHVIFKRSGVPGIDPFLMIVVGIMHYTVVSAVLSASCNAIVARANVLMHVRVEPLVFVALEFLKELRKGLEYLVILFVCYIYFAPTPHWGLAIYPVLIFVMFAGLWGPCLALSVSNVFYRDVAHFVRMVLRVLIFLCPVIYHFSAVPERFWPFYFMNPLAGVFAWLQWSLLGGTMPPIWPLLWAVGCSLIVLALGQWVYRTGRPKLAKRF